MPKYKRKRFFMTIDENLLKTRKHIHFIGIGGSGIGAHAVVLLEKKE